MHTLDQRILNHVLTGRGEFESLALEVFDYQFHANPAYRSYCEGQKRIPSTILSWRDIPPVPALAFKWMEVACEPTDRAERVFFSSGTTQTVQRSRHFLFNLKLYEASIRAGFKRFLLPDRERILTFILMPPAEQAPHSSLSYMLDYVRREFGETGSDHFVSSSYTGEDLSLASDRLAERLQSVDEPVMLLGASFSFVHFLDYCRENNLRFALPHGSRLMDTGGFKGKSREVERDELYRHYQDLLGVPPEFCVNEYGMSEISSQFYDHIAGEPIDATLPCRLYRPPHWVRTLIINPNTMLEAERGASGILRHFDLANRGSAMVIQTEDLGRAEGEGFVLLGRATGAESRGCSLAMDELLQRSRSES